MINIETIEVSGLKGAILGMRNPFKNRDKSDSCVYDLDSDMYPIWTIGPKDLELCQKLLRAGGDDDSKFMRYIHVQADVNAPLYWWKEFDTYKVATVANSESTMHTIHKREFTYNDFSHDQLLDDYTIDEDWGLEDTNPQLLLEDTIRMLNELRRLYLKAIEEKKSDKARDYWYNMIQLLPSSYMQKRTVDLNYQTLRRIYFARRKHKLNEWSGDDGFCDWIFSLPYAEDLITYYILSDEEFKKKKDVFVERAKKLALKMSSEKSSSEEIDRLNSYIAKLKCVDKASGSMEALREQFDIPSLEFKYHIIGGLV